MKKNALVIVAVFTLVLGCGGATTPDAVVRKAIDAVENGDGEALIGYLCADDIEDLNFQIEEMKVNSEESAAFLVMMGIDVSAEDVENMDGADLLTWMLQSDMMRAELPDFGNMEIGEPVIEGDEAVVPIVLEGENEEIELVREDGEWKLGVMPM